MTDENKTGDKPETKSSLPVFDFIFGLLDRIFKDGATGKILAGRVITIIILFALFMIWSKGEDYMRLYKEATFEHYAEVIRKEKDTKFDAVVQEQLQIVHVASGADFSAVYVFRPKNMNYFVDMEVYEGKIPDSLDPKNLGGYPIDKTSNEYSEHLAGRGFWSTEEFAYLPTTDELKYKGTMFSCPYFNLDNVYSGSISMYWDKGTPVNKKRLDAICNQAARAIGRSR